MAQSTVQRNNLVSPFPVTTPILANKNNPNKDKTHDPQSGVSYVHTKWFQEVGDAANSSAQVTANVPTSSTSKGQPGTIAWDSNWLYVCVGQNIWRRTPLAAF